MQLDSHWIFNCENLHIIPTTTKGFYFHNLLVVEFGSIFLWIVASSTTITFFSFKKKHCFDTIHMHQILWHGETNGNSRYTKIASSS
jgi:hypothetical protein